MPIVTLTTDFGDRDGFVGAMKGVILSLAPQAQVVDIAHGIDPHQVPHGALVLSAAAPYFPPDTVHVAVVDPGVGTRRRAVAVETASPRQIYVAPDNGLLTCILADLNPLRAVTLSCSAVLDPPASATFHGRDLFAPAGARLARGVPLAELGDEVALETLVRLPLPRVRSETGVLEGEVIYLDRFGNAMTNLGIADLEAWGGAGWRGQTQVEPAGGPALPLVRAYGDVAPGQPLALINSLNRLEIAVCEGRADTRLGLRPGHVVRVARREGSP